MTKLINVAPTARVIIAATISMAAAGANAQQIGNVENGRRLAHEVCAECHAIDNGTSTSTHPDAPSFKDIAKNSRHDKRGPDGRAADPAQNDAQPCDKRR